MNRVTARGIGNVKQLTIYLGVVGPRNLVAVAWSNGVKSSKKWKVGMQKKEAESIHIKSWSKEIPKLPGWYLRANPPCPGFQKHHLIILDVDCAKVKKGELGIGWGGMRRVSDLPSFYWLGPIEEIPKEILR